MQIKYFLLAALPFVAAGPHGAVADEDPAPPAPPAGDAPPAGGAPALPFPMPTAVPVPAGVMPGMDASHEMPVPTFDPVKFSALRADFHAYISSVKANPLMTSAKAVMATAIPSEWVQSMMDNPSAALSAAKAKATPEWYNAIPQDIKDFFQQQKDAASSIMVKDIGPIPTNSVAAPADAPAPGKKAAESGSSSASAASPASTESAGASSGAESLRVGAAAAAGAVGLVALALL